MTEQKIPLSVAIITKNEEKKLPDCLKSVSFADDIVVVDSGSTDRTLEIAKEFGCRVFVERWKGYGPQKNSAIDKCKHEWVLILDADERIPQETMQKIIEIMENPTVDACSFPRKNYFHGRWIKSSGWWPDRVVRLFKKSKGRITDSLVHESVIVNGKIKKANTPIIHYPVENLNDMISKINLYSSLGAEELFKKGKRTSIFMAFLKGFVAFLKLYFLRLGFLEGFEGFAISFYHAVNTTYKYLKLKEKSLTRR